MPIAEAGLQWAAVFVFAAAFACAVASFALTRRERWIAAALAVTLAALLHRDRLGTQLMRRSMK